MDRRLELHEKLIALLGSSRAYFQPPESLKLEYPCVVYELSDVSTKKANDKLYLHKKRYDLLYITKAADDVTYDKILHNFELVTFDRYYRSDNLHHYAITLYY